MTPHELIEMTQTTPEKIVFDDVMSVINEHYDYTPTSFSNGEITNAVGTNEGSCKIFAFAQLH